MTSAVPIRLVSAPPPARRCGFCGGALFAIERWHDCPNRRLAAGLHFVRMAALAQQSPERRRFSWGFI